MIYYWLSGREAEIADGWMMVYLWQCCWRSSRSPPSVWPGSASFNTTPPSAQPTPYHPRSSPHLTLQYVLINQTGKIFTERYVNKEDIERTTRTILLCQTHRLIKKCIELNSLQHTWFSQNCVQSVLFRKFILGVLNSASYLKFI